MNKKITYIVKGEYQEEKFDTLALALMFMYKDMKNTKYYTILTEGN